MLAALLFSAAAAAPVPNSSAAVPSLRNGLKGDALGGHRWLSVPVNGTHALEAECHALGLPPHLAWVNDAGSLELIVPPSLDPKVSSLLAGRRYEVLHEDAQLVLEREKAERAAHPYRRGGAMAGDEFYRAWRTLTEILDYMRALASAQPSVAVEEFIVGETHEGRPIVGFKVTASPSVPQLPKIMMHGCHHSGEWITASEPSPPPPPAASPNPPRGRPGCAAPLSACCWQWGRSTSSSSCSPNTARTPTSPASSMPTSGFLSPSSTLMASSSAGTPTPSGPGARLGACTRRISRLLLRASS